MVEKRGYGCCALGDPPYLGTPPTPRDPLPCPAGPTSPTPRAPPLCPYTARSPPLHREIPPPTPRDPPPPARSPPPLHRGFPLPYTAGPTPPKLHRGTHPSSYTAGPTPIPTPSTSPPLHCCVFILFGRTIDHPPLFTRCAPHLNYDSAPFARK